MSLEFAKSEASTIGVEWELALVDPKTGDLKQNANQIIDHVNSKAKPHETPLEYELMMNTVEIATNVCHTVDEAMKDLASTVSRILKEADDDDTRLIAMGLHPTAKPSDQEITDKDRYTTILENMQVWARHLMIWGIHVHVGVDDKDKVIPIMNGLLSYAPQFIALSASSPYWQGQDSGYASNRTMLFQQFPSAGIPPRLDGWEDYSVVIEGMQQSHMIKAPQDLRWDVRPAPHFGTIELRLCDGMASLKEIAAITAMSQCLVDQMSEHLDTNYKPMHLPQWFLRENKWRAARYGLDTDIVVDGRGNERPLRDEILRTVDSLQSRAERLGCLKELNYIKEMVANGVSYERQRAEREEGASFTDIVLANSDVLQKGLNDYK